ncbi:MAG: hypothetical protein GY702_24795 [Desulfobulbaceae bacterium]|nr:hypothetical protein [Desulfobulbaceae bacterium]
MNIFQSKMWMILFALFVTFFVLINSPVASTRGAWTLVEQSSEDTPTPLGGEQIVNEVKTSATSCSLKMRYRRPGKGGYSGGSNCEANWSIPPKIMIPDEKIQFIRQASLKGQDTRGGYFNNAGCNVSVYITLMNPDGRVVMGRTAPMETCDPRIGSGAGRSSDSCNVKSEWLVPKGNHKDILYFSPTVRGEGGKGIRHFKYVFNADAKPPPPPKQPPEESLEVSLTSNKLKVYVGESVELTAIVHGGRAPFTYEWSIGEKGTRNARQYQTTKSFSTPGTKTVSVTVIDGNRKSESAEVVITVRRRSAEVQPEGCPDSARLYRPAGLTPHPGQRVKAGIYELWVGQSNARGSRPGRWRTHRQYRLEGGNKYLFLINDFGPELPQVLKNPSDLIQYSTPTKDVAVAYYRIKTLGDKWAATCLKRLGPLTLGNTRPGVFSEAPCAWDTINPRGHSDTPGITIGRSLRPGGWWLWLADAGANGRDEPNKWTRHGPYIIKGNNSYLFHLSQFEDPSLKMDPLVNPGQVLRYETQRDSNNGKTYFENYTIGGHWAAVCFAPATKKELEAISPSDADTSGTDRDGRYVPVGSVKLASTHNKAAVKNGPSVPIVINTKTSILVKTIQTYHWNGGRGSEPGTISIQGSDGQILGPWQAKGLANLSGKSGPPSLYWRVAPQVVLKPGKYRIIDSDPATWATNATAGNRGFFKMEHQKVEIHKAEPVIELGD